MSDTEDIVTRLRMLGGLDAALCNKAADEIRRLRAERDEARQIACLQSCMGDDEPREWSPEDFAKQQGWDCFKGDK
jgi:hypothetical protein